MANNKVEAFGQTLIDLTEDSVTPDTLAKGVTAHNAAGDKITGTMERQVVDILSTKEELEANTEAGKVVDALVVKDINSCLGGLSFGTDGDGNYGYYGADGSLIPFKGSPIYIAQAFCRSSIATGAILYDVKNNYIMAQNINVTTKYVECDNFKLQTAGSQIILTIKKTGIYDIVGFGKVAERYKISYQKINANTTYKLNGGDTELMQSFLIVNAY